MRFIYAARKNENACDLPVQWRYMLHKYTWQIFQVITRRTKNPCSLFFASIKSHKKKTVKRRKKKYAGF
ncbi:hypothetical protein [Undibacterium sp. TJN19]|uniref:hypothetical protein n=1 Tax=Undibacterium sp. TJN19 TaxID=3413055 RepID=UPI003BF4CE91